MTKKREHLFSVTAKDCRWDYLRGSGKGGQKRNKTNSAVRCTHKASGAVGYAEDSRSQHDNKKIAFKRMVESKAFQEWHKLEVARKSGQLLEIEEQVDYMMEPHNVKEEVYRDGKWKPYERLQDGNETQDN